MARLVERVVAAPVPDGLVKEIIIVNDASTDNTQTVIDELLTRFPQIRAFTQPVNSGKGAAIRRAIQEMTGSYCIIQDADLEYDPSEYPIVLKPLLEAGADAVYGSRFANREMKRVLFYHHKLGNMFITHLSNLATGLDLTDMETCYKAFRADLLKTIPIRSNRFGIEPELTAKIAKRNFTVYEVPISYHGRQYSEGKKIGWKDGISAVWTIIKYRLIDDCYTEESGFTVLHRIDRARAYTLHLVQKMEPYFGATVLELGSGIGQMSKYLPQKRSLTLSDPNPEYVNLLQTSYRDNAVVDVIPLDIQSQDDVQELIAQERRFDTLVMFQQLERADDDAQIQILKHAESLLNPGGRLLLFVPYNPMFFGPRDASLGIKRRYRKAEILDKLASVGLVVEKANRYHFLAYLGHTFNLFWRQTRPLNKVQLKIYNSLVPLFGFLEKWLPLSGADLFIVARKPETQKSEAEA